MLNTIKSVADKIFWNAEEQALIARTRTSHKDASKLFKRTLNEITKLYRIEGIYTLDEEINEANTKYVFSEMFFDESIHFKESLWMKMKSIVLTDW